MFSNEQRKLPAMKFAGVAGHNARPWMYEFKPSRWRVTLQD